jgi:hypothetical protein
VATSHFPQSGVATENLHKYFIYISYLIFLFENFDDKNKADLDRHTQVHYTKYIFNNSQKCLIVCQLEHVAYHGPKILIKIFVYAYLLFRGMKMFSLLFHVHVY